MAQCLGRVAQVSAVGVELFGIQPQRIGITQQLFEFQVRLLDPSGTGQAFDIPEGAGGKSAFVTRQTIVIHVVVPVPIDHAVAHQETFDGVKGR